MKYTYRAYDRTGRELVDVVEAGARPEADELLRKRGLFVKEIREHVEQGGARGLARGSGGRGSLRDVSAFMRQVGVLLSTGTPLVDAIGAVERQTPEGRFRQVLADVRERVEEGTQFSEALGAHPRQFDAVCRSLVAAGEGAGNLEEMLARLSALMRQQIKMRAMVVGAMVYPMVLVSIAVIVLVVMIGFVLPRFEGLFESLDAPLPTTTMVLLEIGGFCRSYWWAVVPGILASVGGVVYAFTQPGVRRRLEGVLLRLPQIGRLVRSLTTARLTRVLGVLLGGKVPMIEALELTKQTVTIEGYKVLIERAQRAVERGESMSDAFDDDRLVSASVREAIRSGERAGRIAPVLLSLAEYMDEDNEVAVRSLSSVIEPLILTLLGLVVGVVALSMFLPLFDLTASAGSF